MSGRLRQLVSAFLVLSSAAAPAIAGPKVPTAPGVYMDWAGEIDQLEIVQTFKLSDYSKVIVEPFDTKDTPLPAKDDNTYKPVTRVLADPAKPFTENLSKEMRRRVPVSQGSAGEGQVLIVRARVTNMDPGSRAFRFWGDLGGPDTGAVRTELQGEVVDAATGKALLRFRQERRLGSAGLFGEGYVSLMSRNLRQLGKDVAGILKAF